MIGNPRTTEASRLATRMQAMRSTGLVDVRLSIRGRDTATTESVSREVNCMLDAHERGESAPLDFRDGLTAQ